MSRNRKLGLILCVAALPILLWACPIVDPLELPGPYDVYFSDEILVDNPEIPELPLPARVYGPSEDGGETLAQGTFGLVIFMPGYNADYVHYWLYLKHMASHGFIVVGMNYHVIDEFDREHDYTARQALYVLDWALGEDSPVDGRADPSKIAMAGHSLGGKMSFYAAYLDDRIRVVMAMDPTNCAVPACYVAPDICNPYLVAPDPEYGDVGLLDDIDVASMIIRMEPDVFSPSNRWNAAHYWTGLDGEGSHGVRAPAVYFDMGDAGHMSFLFRGDATVPGFTKRTMIAWLKTQFEGESLDEYFIGAAVRE